MSLSTPNWQSVIVLPLLVDEKVKAVGYITVPIKEKEFDFNSYNLQKHYGIFFPLYCKIHKH